MCVIYEIETYYYSCVTVCPVHLSVGHTLALCQDILSNYIIELI